MFPYTNLARPIEILPVTVNPGDDEQASEYETTKGSLNKTESSLVVERDTYSRDGAVEVATAVSNAYSLQGNSVLSRTHEFS